MRQRARKVATSTKYDLTITLHSLRWCDHFGLGEYSHYALVLRASWAAVAGGAARPRGARQWHCRARTCVSRERYSCVFPVFQVAGDAADDAPISWLQVAYQDAASGETEEDS